MLPDERMISFSPLLLGATADGIGYAVLQTHSSRRLLV